MREIIIREDDEGHFEILGQIDPWWARPLSTRTVATLSFVVGFALCFLIFVS